MVAGALNTIAGGPNRSAPIEVKGRVDGTISRGSGRDVHAQGTITPPVLHRPIRVGAQGTLDPLTPGKAEVSASGIRGTGGGLPSRVRVYNTPTGELDIDLGGPVKVFGVPMLGGGAYVIGQPDPPARRR